jgi:hypothetical protein
VNKLWKAATGKGFRAEKYFIEYLEVYQRAVYLLIFLKNYFTTKHKRGYEQS